MNLLYRWIDEHEGWKSTTLEKERTCIETFHNLEVAKKRLIDREIILCGVKVIRLYNGVV